MQLSVRDVAKLLTVTEKTVYRWIQGGSLPAYRLEGQYRINKSLLLEWATAKKINMPADLFHSDDPHETLSTLTETLKAGGIHYRVEGSDKAGVLRAVVELLNLPAGTDREFLFQALWARENLQSTGLGDGVAVPHVRNPVILSVETPMISLCFLEQPVDFGALDGVPVSVVFTLISPTVRMHLHLLSRLAFALRDRKFRAVLSRAGARDEICRELQRVEDGVGGPA